MSLDSNQRKPAHDPPYGHTSVCCRHSRRGCALAQGTAPQPQPAQPGMMVQMPSMQPHMRQMQQRMMPGAQPPAGGAAQAPATTGPHPSAVMRRDPRQAQALRALRRPLTSLTTRPAR